MPKSERKENLESFYSMEAQVVVCNELLVEGWDCPQVEAVGILRPTLQQYRYTQMIGRGTRPCIESGKEDVLVVDFDWKTDVDAKDLCCTVDLFDDGSIDDAIFPIARQLAAERAIDSDPLELIEEAERILRTKQRFRVKLTGKEDTYRSWEHDPVGVSKILDIKLNRKYDLDKKGVNPASEAQLHKLASLGVQAPESLSKWGASKMIGKLVKRLDRGESTVSQVQALMSSGLNADVARRMSYKEAVEAIAEIDGTKIPTKRTQSVMF